jgi:hypothetical protein
MARKKAPLTFVCPHLSDSEVSVPLTTRLKPDNAQWGQKYFFNFQAPVI